jgi:ketosteroid isomerase-like protein
MHFFYLVTIISTAMIMSCNMTVSDTSVQIKEMMNADREFSAMSQSKGMKAAFLHYLDSNGVLLRPDHYPIIGKDAISFLRAREDSSFTLTWEPQSGELATSGDLGYTYGLYTFLNKDTTFQGVYVSIWKKQNDGDWKFVLDTGNPGVGKK